MVYQIFFFKKIKDLKRNNNNNWYFETQLKKFFEKRTEEGINLDGGSRWKKNIFGNSGNGDLFFCSRTSLELSDENRFLRTIQKIFFPKTTTLAQQFCHTINQKNLLFRDLFIWNWTFLQIRVFHNSYLFTLLQNIIEAFCIKPIQMLLW